MNRIDLVFKKLKDKKKKAFITYVAAGDPNIKTSKEVVKAIASSGADIIELGIPFSDPLADGPTIQSATERALEAGCTVKKVLNMVKELRKTIETPFVFMTYYNIVLHYGVKKFIRAAKEAGCDGLIVPDVPMEESEELVSYGKKEDFKVIMLTAPTTPNGRFKKIAKISSGFIYHVSLTGVTGARKSLSKELNSDVKKLKKLTKKPLCVGFGVSTPAQAEGVAKAADGVIVGSAIIKVMEKYLKDKKNMAKAVSRFVKTIAKAVHGV